MPAPSDLSPIFRSPLFFAQVEHHRRPTFQQEYLAFQKRHEHSTHSTRCRLLIPGLRFDDKSTNYLCDRQCLRPSRDGASLHLYPGTSCLATIGLSLRDKNPSQLRHRIRIEMAAMDCLTPAHPTHSTLAQAGASNGLED
jgi:hypothetical protein